MLRGAKVKLITRDTDYAVRALCFIGQRKKKLVSASELVASLKIPQARDFKLMQR
jgi:DNA-binding IscR family transcriptional regulator